MHQLLEVRTQPVYKPVMTRDSPQALDQIDIWLAQSVAPYSTKSQGQPVRRARLPPLDPPQDPPPPTQPYRRIHDDEVVSDLGRGHGVRDSEVVHDAAPVLAQLICNTTARRAQAQVRLPHASRGEMGPCGWPCRHGVTAPPV